MKKTHTNADMSHQNSIRYKVGEFFDSLKINGFTPTINKIAQQIFYKIKGIDFSTQNLHDLTLTGDYKEHGTALVSTSKDFFKRVMCDLEEIVSKDIKKEVFLDYGSGKGGAIIHARYAGFKKSIGIEFAKELHDKAVSNIKKLGLNNVESYYQDATEYLPPLDVSLIYLFNPFDEVVMEKVSKNILSQKDKYQNEVYIVYGNPSCDVLDRYFELLGERNHDSGAVVRYYKLT
jgi:16S rRNA G966 N2-methylase RsmD